jgi:O-antigen ligase
MNSSATFVERHKNLLLVLTTAWVASGTILAVRTPLTMPALLVLSTIAPVAWSLSTYKRVSFAKPSVTTVALSILGGYLAVNASWAISQSVTGLSLGMFFFVVVALHFGLIGLASSDQAPLRAMAVGLFAGLAIGGAFMFIELFSQQWIHRQLMSLIPLLRPQPRHLIVQGDTVLIEYYLLNRSVAALTLLFWPTMLIVQLLAPARRHGWLLFGLVPAVAAILGSKHATSKIAFVGAAVTIVAIQIWPFRASRAITWAWGAIIVLVVPMAMLAYHSQLYLSDWLPRSGQHRIVIWGYTSQQIFKAPILGVGINTARALDEAQRYDADVPLAPGSDLRLATSRHSHNGYLQTWYEVGAVGAAFLLALGLLVLQSIANAPIKARPYLYATFVACALMGGSSFSLWQPWFMATFGLVAIFAALGWALASSEFERAEKS